MSLNFISDRFLSCEDDEFVLKVDKDIRDYFENPLTNSVLLFPPVNSYRRFLIHKVCESVVKNESSKNFQLTTFSIGLEPNRRTVVCRKQQLINNPKTERSETENEFAWHYLKRNSVPKSFNHFDYQSERRNNREPRGGRIMGIENVDATASAQKNNLSDCSNVDASTIEINSFSDDQLSAKKLSRTRRPDRAVYIPRAKRSQTTPPATTITNSVTSSTKSHRNKSDRKLKSKSIDESHSSSNSEEQNEEEEVLSSPECHSVINPQLDISSSCDQSCEVSPTDTKNQKNFQNLCTMSQQSGSELIENSASCAEETKTDKVDKDEKELMKASQEMNRSNRKLIKQSFNSDVLEIKTAEGAASNNSKNDEAVNQEDDDWDTLFNDDGDCLDPKMVDEITKAVGKVTIEKPKLDYSSYHTNVDLLKNQEFPHVLECSNFPVEFRTQDLMALFAPHAKETGFDIKWVDDTHCLVVFSSSKVAAEVLTATHPLIRLKPLAEATQESRTKARKCSSSLQPYRQRPETCAALAKRLVSGALGVRLKPTTEERENERRVLREAKERKLLAAKNRQEREDAWNN